MTTIDLSKLPAPDLVAPLDFETEFATMRADLVASLPALADVLSLESEPLTKLLQVFAYQKVGMQARVNDAARACMLAYAGGSDLDNLAALLAVQRLDSDTEPPEADSRLRLRTQMALEGETVAGSAGSYIFHALSASSLVKDAGVDSPVPGTVRVTVLSTDGNGTAPPELLAAVQAYLSADEVRPLSDTVVVESAAIVSFSIEASLNVYPGPAAAPLLAAARAATQAYVTEHARLGHDITLSGLYACLHQPGVQRVGLVSPAVDLVIGPTQAAWCESISISIGAVDV